MENKMQRFDILGYSTYLVETLEDLEYIRASAPSKLSMFAFDTESNTVIDMVKDMDNIDIMHDTPFIVAFGYGHEVFFADLRVFTHVKELLEVFRDIADRAVLNLAHNIKFDIHMLLNIGYVWNHDNGCDTMSIARLALESKTEREGGYNLALKPLATRLLGSTYSDLGKEVREAMRKIWQDKIKDLAKQLKPYKVKRADIEKTLRSVGSTLDEYSTQVQLIFNTWSLTSDMSFQDIPVEILYKYAAVDVILVLEIAKKLLPIVSDKMQLDILKEEMKLIMPLVRMERTGYTVDKSYLIRSKQAIIFEYYEIKERNFKILGVDLAPSQHKEIKAHLLEKFGYELESTDKNKLHILIMTDATMPIEVQEYLKNTMYLRTLEKWLSTYINSMLGRLNRSGDTKVYTMYNPNGAVSGRFSSNFQQFPKFPIYSKIGDFALFHPRKMFVIDSKYQKLGYIDYSQVELRIQAEYTYRATKGTGDVNMLRAYMPFKCIENHGRYYLMEDQSKEWQSVDLHTQATKTAFPTLDVTSDEFKKMRNVGKRVNFALIYGAGLKTVKETLADVPAEIVSRLYQGFHDRFPDVKVYNLQTQREWVANGGYVQNLLGRRYYISDSYDVYKLNNYLIQGSAADIMKRVIVAIDDYIKDFPDEIKMQGTIHDEITFVLREGAEHHLVKIKEIMETTVKLYVPLIAEISISHTSWADKEDYNA